MSTVDIIPTYAYDPTGELPENRIVERHTISEANRNEFRIILPKKAPYFTESLTVTKVELGATSTPLIYGKDYYYGAMFGDMTPYTKNNIAVAGLVVLHDEVPAGNYEITYQTLGGDYVLDERDAAERLRNHLNNPFMVEFKQLKDLPSSFPPEPHGHHEVEMDQYSDLVFQMEQLVQVLSRYMEDDKQGSPSYNQLLVELINQGKQILTLNNDLTNLEGRLNKSTSGQISGAIERINVVSAELDKKAKDLDTHITGIVNQSIAQVNADVASARQSLADAIADMTRNSGELTNNINQRLNDAITLVNQTLNNAKNDLEEKVNQIRANMNQEVADLRGEINNAKTNLQNQMNQFRDLYVKKAGDTMTGSLRVPDISCNWLRSFTNDTSSKRHGGLRIESGYAPGIMLRTALIHSDEIGVESLTHRLTGLHLGPHAATLAGNKVVMSAGEFILASYDEPGHTGDIHGGTYTTTGIVLDIVNKNTLSFHTKTINFGESHGYNNYTSYKFPYSSSNSSSNNCRLKARDFYSTENGLVKLSETVKRTGDCIEGSILMPALVHPCDSILNKSLFSRTSTVEPNSERMPVCGFKASQNPHSIDASKPIFELQMSSQWKGNGNRPFMSYGLSRTLSFKQASGENDYRLFTRKYHDERLIGERELLTTDHIAQLNETDQSKLVTVGTLGTLIQTQPEPTKNDMSLGYNKIPYTRPDGSIHLGTDVFIHKKMTSGASGENKVKLSYSEQDPRYGRGVLVDGHVKCTSVYQSSDIRYKEDVQPIKDGLGLLKQIEPKQYRMIETKQKQFGVIAQEVLAVAPQMVTVEPTDPHRFLSVDYTQFIPLLIDAVKTLSDKVDKQEKEIRLLKEQLGVSNE